MATLETTRMAELLNQRVFLVSNSDSNKQLGARPDGTVYTHSNRLAWETWTVQDAGNGEVFLVSTHNTQLGSTADGSVYTNSNRLAWERWRIELTDGGRFLFTSVAHGLHLGARPNGFVYTHKNQQGWEQWSVTKVEEAIVRKMYQLPGYRDAEDLKWKIATDPNIIRTLASFAHILGFGWCGGTRSQAVGEDFDVRKDGDSYILQAHYDKNDPFHDGYWADKRLRIKLSNFQIGFAPRSFVYGTPVIKDLVPAAIATYLTRNEGNTEDSITKTFTFQLSETVTHSTNVSFTEGLKVSFTGNAKIPFFDVGRTTEFSFSAQQGWSDSTATSLGQQDTCTYTGKLPPSSQRLIRLIANRVSSDITYSALAQVGFDIEFYGFLRWSGNARADHPGDRPFVTLKFGEIKDSKTYNGFEDIWNKWQNRQITGYWGWDWGWMQNNYGKMLERTMNFIGNGIGAPVSGKFNDIKGTNVFISADKPQPLTTQTIAVMEAREVTQVATVAATRETLRAASVPNTHIPDAFLLHTDEIPGGRVINIE